MTEWLDFIGVAEADGWDSQIRDGPTINLFYDRSWRRPIMRGRGFGADLIPPVGGALGNASTDAAVGISHDSG